MSRSLTQTPRPAPEPPMRTILPSGAGLLLGLAVAALGSFAACGSTPRGVEPGASPAPTPLCPALVNPPPVTADLASILGIFEQQADMESLEKFVDLFSVFVFVFSFAFQLFHQNAGVLCWRLSGLSLHTFYDV